jgi:hypothetical protein
VQSWLEQVCAPMVEYLKAIPGPVRVRALFGSQYAALEAAATMYSSLEGVAHVQADFRMMP